MPQPPEDTRPEPIPLVEKRARILTREVADETATKGAPAQGTAANPPGTNVSGTSPGRGNITDLARTKP